jgi:hypothetical protein
VGIGVGVTVGVSVGVSVEVSAALPVATGVGDTVGSGDGTGVGVGVGGTTVGRGADVAGAGVGTPTVGTSVGNKKGERELQLIRNRGSEITRIIRKGIVRVSCATLDLSSGQSVLCAQF